MIIVQHRLLTRTCAYAWGAVVDVEFVSA